MRNQTQSPRTTLAGAHGISRHRRSNRNPFADLLDEIPGSEPSQSERGQSRIGHADRWEGKLYIPLSEAFEKVGQAEQLIRNWLPSTGVSFVLAQFGVGKTLLLLDQALCLATDRDWMGYPTTPGRFSIYLCGEDQEGTLANAAAWCKQHRVDPTDIKTRVLFVPLTPDLLDQEDCKLLIGRVREKLPDGARPVIFIDTWQRSTAMGGQNEDKDMQAAIKNAEFIGKELGGPVIAASHPPKNNAGTISGSGVIQNSSVAIWDMRPVGKSTTRRVVRVTRIKGAGQGTQLSVTIETLQIDGRDNYGCPRTGAIIVKDAATSTEGKIEPSRSVLALAETGTASDPLAKYESDLLFQLAATPKASFVKLAKALNWYGETGRPNDSRIKNTMGKLARDGLVTQDRDGRYYPTESGHHAVATLPRPGTLIDAITSLAR